MTYAKSNNGTIHLVNSLNPDYSLCGDLCDCDESQYAWSPCEPESVTCKLCIGVVESCREVKLKVKVPKIFDVVANADKCEVDFNKTNKFTKNGWISPEGDFYCLESAEHLQTANWICLKFKTFPKPPKDGDFFKETCECVLRKLGWAVIKDTSSFITSHSFEDAEVLAQLMADSLKIFLADETTPAQTKTIKNYCEAFGVDSGKYLPRV